MVWVAGTVAATVLAWLLGLVLTMKLDRATGAYYYRRSLLLVMVLILGILTGVGWWLVWRMMYLPLLQMPGWVKPVAVGWWLVWRMM